MHLSIYLELEFGDECLLNIVFISWVIIDSGLSIINISNEDDC